MKGPNRNYIKGLRLRAQLRLSKEGGPKASNFLKRKPQIVVAAN